MAVAPPSRSYIHPGPLSRVRAQLSQGHPTGSVPRTLDSHREHTEAALFSQRDWRCARWLHLMTCCRLWCCVFVIRKGTLEADIWLRKAEDVWYFVSMYICVGNCYFISTYLHALWLFRLYLVQGERQDLITQTTTGRRQRQVATSREKCK